MAFRACCRARSRSSFPGLRYSQLIPALELAGITLNRKMLSEIAIADPAAFDLIVEAAKKFVPAQSNAKAA